jgi:hypothetical protein
MKIYCRLMLLYIMVTQNRQRLNTAGRDSSHLPSPLNIISLFNKHDLPPCRRKSEQFISLLFNVIVTVTDWYCKFYSKYELLYS